MEGSSFSSSLYIVKAISPVHSGGAGGNYIVDFAIQREVSNHIPKIDASSWKGSIRQAIKNKDNNKWQEYAKDIVCSDLKLLFFPVKTALNSFVFVTSKKILGNLKEWSLLHQINDERGIITSISSLASVIVGEGRVLATSTTPWIHIGSCPYKVQTLANKNRKDTLVKERIEILANLIDVPKEKIVIMNHKDFCDVVTYETEYVTRIRIGEEKTTEDKHLFVEEYLPEESILYGTITYFENILKSDGKEQAKAFIEENMPKQLQIGKNSTLGKGQIQLEKAEYSLKGGE